MPLQVTTVPFQLAPEEYVPIYSQIQNKLGLLYFPVLGLLLLIAGFASEQQFLFGAGFAFLVFGLFGPVSRRRLVQQMGTNFRSRWFFTENRTVHITSDSIITEMANGTYARHPWSVISTVQVRNQCIALGLGSSHLIIPLRAVPSAEDRHAIADFLTQKNLLNSAKAREILEAGYVSKL